MPRMSTTAKFASSGEYCKRVMGTTLGNTVLSFVPVFASKEYTPVRSVAASKTGGKEWGETIRYDSR